jgi:hypothetical protein
VKVPAYGVANKKTALRYLRLRAALKFRHLLRKPSHAEPISVPRHGSRSGMASMLATTTEGTAPSGTALFEHIDDAVAATIEDVALLDDDALKRGGLAPVRAFVRTRQSTTGQRSARHRERQEANGRRQLNLTIPAEDGARAAMKELARAMSAGLVTPSHIGTLIARPGAATSAAPAHPAPASATPDGLAADLAQLREVLARGGLRARLVRWLVGLDIGGGLSPDQRPSMVDAGTDPRGHAPSVAGGSSS